MKPKSEVPFDAKVRLAALKQAVISSQGQRVPTDEVVKRAEKFERYLKGGWVLKEVKDDEDVARSGKGG